LKRQVRGTITSSSTVTIVDASASQSASIDANLDAEVPMRTTVTLDDELVARAEELTGRSDRSGLLRQALEALIAQESGRRLARLGGSDRTAEAAPRRRRAAS
jgi:predicted transcriptional regulator